MNKERGNTHIDVIAGLALLGLIISIIVLVGNSTQRETIKEYKNKCFNEAHLELEYLFCKSLFNDKDSK